MEINSERFKSLVDKIFGLREDLEELEGVIFAITEADKSEPQDWLEVYLRDQTTQAIDLKQSREAVAAVVEKARASGATRDKNWWFCIYAPMAELNNNENSKSCFWDSDERGEYKAFFVLMHQWLEEDTKDFIDEAWTKSFSSEKKTWKKVGMLDRCERNRTLTPHECWADYALKKRLKQWNEKQARKARTAYELWVALRSCVNSDNVINGT